MSYEKIIQLNDSSLFEIYLSARMVRAYDYCPVPVNQQLSLLEEGRTTENKQKHISCGLHVHQYGQANKGVLRHAGSKSGLNFGLALLIS